MAESRQQENNRNQAIADILQTMRLELQADSLMIKAIQEKITSLQSILEDHHRVLYEGSGTMAIQTQLVVFQRAIDDLESWRRAVDVYRENIRVLHVQMHQESDGKALDLVREQRQLGVSIVTARSGVKSAALTAGASLLAVLLTALMAHLHWLPWPK